MKNSFRRNAFALLLTAPTLISSFAQAEDGVCGNTKVYRNVGNDISISVGDKPTQQPLEIIYVNPVRHQICIAPDENFKYIITTPVECWTGIIPEQILVEATVPGINATLTSTFFLQDLYDQYRDWCHKKQEIRIGSAAKEFKIS